MDIMKPRRLHKGGTIGIVAPCLRFAPEVLQKSIENLNRSGFKVKLSSHLYSDADVYAGSVSERAEDFNTMASDPEVDMLFFEGGEVSNELLPYLDYEAIRSNPKIYCSFSDSTTLLNAIYCRSGIVTYYGSSPMVFDVMMDYNISCFFNTLVQGSDVYTRSGDWHSMRGGSCTGILIGGYLLNFALLQNTNYFHIEPDKRYILFLEDHISFNGPPAVARYVAHIEQSGLFQHISGVIIGNYAEGDQSEAEKILARLADRYQIPAVKTDDFGHGKYHSILPIGINAQLDADRKTLVFLESAFE